MNQIETNLKTCIINAVKQAFDLDWESGDVVIEIPKEKIHGDYSTNAAMRLTKQLRQNPRMIAQQLILNLITIIDNVMVGRYGDLFVSSAAIVNRLFTVPSSFLNGILAGGVVFLAQYAGIDQPQRMTQTFRFSLAASIALLFPFILAGLAFPQTLIRLFSSDPALEGPAAVYLQLLALSMIPYVLSQAITNAMRAIGKPLALEASAEERETRGFISMTIMRPFSGLTANCTLEPPVSTPIFSRMASDAARMRWYSTSESVCAGATVMESPVCTPIASKFSMEHGRA